MSDKIRCMNEEISGGFVFDFCSFSDFYCRYFTLFPWRHSCRTKLWMANVCDSSRWKRRVRMHFHLSIFVFSAPHNCVETWCAESGAKVKPVCRAEPMKNRTISETLSDFFFLCPGYNCWIELARPIWCSKWPNSPGSEGSERGDG